MTGLKKRWGAIWKSLAVLIVLSILIFVSHRQALRSTLLLPRWETTPLGPFKSSLHHHTHVAVGQQNPTIAPALPVLGIGLSYILGQTGNGSLSARPQITKSIDNTGKMREKRQVGTEGSNGPIQCTEDDPCADGSCCNSVSPLIS